MEVQPYLFFEGRCEEAVEFYRKAVGAEVIMLMRFKDAPAGEREKIPPALQNKVMHMNLRTGDTYLLMSDGHGAGHPAFQASRCRSRSRARPRPSGCSVRWRTAARSGRR